MSITTLLFVFLFLPIALVLYYISSPKSREFVLLLISLLFYSFGAIDYLILFIVAITITILIGRLINYFINKNIRTIFLVIGIIVNTSLLVYYKYSSSCIELINKAFQTDIAIRSVAFPLGISFFTFKAISYLVDVYQSKVVLKDNPMHDALYLSFFGHIQSGPLARYNSMDNVFGGLNTKEKYDYISDGFFRFMIGFNKKVLLSNTLSNITAEVFTGITADYSTAYAWLGAICYSLELFFDFSGYSDMAIGITKMFGYNCLENFNYPYMTESVSKFWRRWHISLSEWFRDYVYIPLGGGRTKKLLVYRNLLIVWLLTGIWHGSTLNFWAWGLGYFAMISFEKLTGFPEKFKSKALKCIYRLFSILFIVVQWVVFRIENFSDIFIYLKNMFIYHGNGLYDSRCSFLIKDYLFFIVTSVLLCFPIIPQIEDRIINNRKIKCIFEIVLGIIISILFVWAVSFVVAGRNNPFAYANF